MNKVNYEPVFKTGVLSSSIYEDGNILELGEKTHIALIKGSEHKFAAFEIISATAKDGSPCQLQSQDCEDGSFPVFAISSLKIKKVFNEDSINSARRLSGGMSIGEILALEAGVKYRLIRTDDGFKKPFEWAEGEPLQQNHSYRLVAVTEPTTSQPTKDE